MSKFLASYDLSNTKSHDALMKAARVRGWDRWIDGSDGDPYLLPATTLVGEFDTIDAAVSSFDAAVAEVARSKEAKTTVSNLVVVQYTAGRVRWKP